MYTTTLIAHPMARAEAGGLLGREVSGLDIIGAAYNFGPKTKLMASLFPEIAQNGMGANVLSDLSDVYTSTFWVLKKGFWLCGAYLNHPERIATIVAISPYPGLSFYGRDLIAEKLDLKEGEVKGIEGLLAERAAHIINTIPKPKHILVLGDN